MHHESRNMNENKSNDLQTIITQVIEEMKLHELFGISHFLITPFLPSRGLLQQTPMQA